MAHLYLVRHGRAAAAFDAHPDPGLDETGQAQAARFARTFSHDLDSRRVAGPLPILTSPLRRTRETAEPLSALWSPAGGPLVEPRVAELPSPPGIALAARGPWVREVLQGRWSDADPALLAWRAALIDCLLALSGDTVIFTHFIAINAAIGAALGADAVMVSQPDHCSCTEIAVAEGRLTLLAEGRQLETRVL